MVSETQAKARNQPNLQQWLAVFFMAACFVVAWVITPHSTWFEHLGKPQFEAVIPKQFGDWEMVQNTAAEIVDPEQLGAINNLYSQTVTRTYVQKSSGRAIMLSLAYGDNQTFSKQLHRPEACYSSQGFKILNLHEQQIKVSGHPIAVNRMTGELGPRLEQVTYWVRIGDTVISGPATSLNKARVVMGLKGYIADGLLFRVSDVGDESQVSNSLHDEFINALLSALPPAQQAMLIGQAQS